MSEVISAATAIFQWLFVGTTGTNAVPAVMTTLIGFITSNSYCLIGLGLMLSGAVLSFLRKLIAVS